jgi:osmotically-inducible protein OsmY
MKESLSMRKYRKCVFTLGLLATAPGVTLAGPLDLLKLGSPSANQPVPARPDNQQVAENIAGVLRTAHLNGTGIEIHFQGGVARISGQVQDASQRAKATYLVEKVPGVERVDNQLTVAEAGPEPLLSQPFSQPPVTAAGAPAALPAAPAIQPAGAPAPAAKTAAGGPSNQEMAERIAKALRKEKLNGYDIQIRFRDGTALLAGGVKDAEQRARAEQAVAAVAGVEHVENRLLVPGRPAGGPPMPPIHPVNFQPPVNGAPPGPLPPNGMPPGQVIPGAPVPDASVYGHPGMGTPHPIYNMPYLPENAWPATAQYPNSAAVQYPTQYSASAWPYIGPFYPYPQVPLGWRQAQLEWDDGHWYLNFRPRTDRWWWFLHPKNW